PQPLFILRLRLTHTISCSGGASEPFFFFPSFFFPPFPFRFFFFFFFPSSLFFFFFFPLRLFPPSISTSHPSSPPHSTHSPAPPPPPASPKTRPRATPASGAPAVVGPAPCPGRSRRA